MVVSEADTAVTKGKSSAGLAGSAKTKATDVAMACHSFWEVEDGEAGKGVEGLDGRAQQPGVAHLPQPESQQLRATRVRFETLPAGTVKTHSHARTNPSRRTTAVFTRRDIIARDLSVRFAIPYRVCQSQERG
jgi:hypothetical protein